MDLFESVFLIECKTDFERLARQSKNEMTSDDLRSESFLMAIQIAERQKRKLDFTCPLDRGLIIGALYNKFVKWTDRMYKTAVRVDQQLDGEDSSSSWFHQLPAPLSCDPLVQLELNEERIAREKLLKSSFSQLSAYVVVFFRFDDDRIKICKHLAIVKDTLTRRLRRAEKTVLRQASLFDKKEKIKASFMPQPGRKYVQMLELLVEDRQQIFYFD